MLLSIPTGVDLRGFEEKLAGARVAMKLRRCLRTMRRATTAVLADR